MSAPVLRPNPRLDPRVSGDTWQVHGGGFHQIQKYMVAPEFLPADLTWFKWEAYSTWIFAFALLMTTYYANPSVYLLDAAVSNIEPLDAVPLALGSLVLGWIGYDRLCHSRIGGNTARLAGCGFALRVLITYGSATCSAAGEHSRGSAPSWVRSWLATYCSSSYRTSAGRSPR